MMSNFFKIRGSVKNYEWGKLGLESAVAQLQKSAFPDFIVKDIPYAELWMGTHASGPAQIPSLQESSLLDWIIKHPDCLGKDVNSFFDFNNGLPFLFKVLSVNKALSIQVHPDKESAVQLHEKFPEHYPDDNHKPEMAIALTEFEALCGFRPLSEIKEFFITIPQLKQLISKDIYESFITSPSEDNLKFLFTALMTSSADSWQSQLIEVVEEFKQNNFKSELCASIRSIVLRIASQYPDDIGCFCLFFLNYLKMKPGEAIFLAANEPHAYLLGDCVECMACSDNVVRAGLTPKFKDVKTLCGMLTYKCRPGSGNIFPYLSDPIDCYLKIYNPPVREFVLDVIELPASLEIYSARSIESASILLVLKGKGTCRNCDETYELSIGNILFISSGSAVKIKPETNMLMYRAHCSK